MLPTREEALALHRSVGSPPGVIAHCKAVARLAREMAEWIDHHGTLIDVNAVEVGALLHDIGRSRTHGMDHAIVGATIVAEAGYPEELTAIIRNHIGTGLSSDEAVALGLPAADYRPRDLEQLVVSHADNLTRNVEYRTLDETVTHFASQGLPRVAARVVEVHEELEALVGVPIESLF